MQMSSYDNIPDQLGFSTQSRKVFKAKACFWYLLFKQIERFVSWRLNYWLSEGLCIFIHDQCFYSRSINLFSIRIVLLIFMQHYMIATLIILFFLNHWRWCAILLTTFPFVSGGLHLKSIMRRLTLLIAYSSSRALVLAIGWFWFSTSFTIRWVIIFFVHIQIRANVVSELIIHVLLFVSAFHIWCFT